MGSRRGAAAKFFPASEAESGLKFHHSPGKRRRCLTEMRVFDDSARASKRKRCQVQLVEYIKEGCAQFQPRLLSQMRVGQGKVFQKTHVHVRVSRAPERVSSDARSSCLTDVKESFSATGKVSIVLEEGGSRTIVVGAAKIRHGAYRRKRLASGELQCLSVCHWSPREAAMGGQDAVDFPSAQHVSEKVMTPAQNRQVPKAGQDKVMRCIIVRRPALEDLVLRERLIGCESRTFIRQLINASAPAVLGFQLKSPVKSARHTHVQRVVTGIDVRRGKKHGGKMGIGGVKDKVLIDDTHQLAAAASLIAQADDEVPGELRFTFERIVIDISGG